MRRSHGINACFMGKRASRRVNRQRGNANVGKNVQKKIMFYKRSTQVWIGDRVNVRYVQFWALVGANRLKGVQDSTTVVSR